MVNSERLVMDSARSVILENRRLANDIYKITLEVPECKFAAPGQFAMVEIPGKYLRRPISVSSYDSERYTMIYKVVGEGTKFLSEMTPGETVDAITGLGNGYNLDEIPDNALLIGGGIGIPPMFGLLKQLIMQGKRAKVVLGFNTKDDIFMVEDFEMFADEVIVMTADGSYGQKGFVTDAFDEAEYVCACGPLKMLRALDPKCKAGQFSLEARMGCGFGGCMGCSIKTAVGPQRVCKEGPVFNKEVLLWDEL